MKAYIITIPGNELSERAAATCIKSSLDVGNEFSIEEFPAVTPDNVKETMLINKVVWNYPWLGQDLDWATGLVKKAYPTKHPAKRIACAMSHFMLWARSSNKDEDILVLEHDAIFTQKFDYQFTLDSKYDIIGINDPRGNTRRSSEFHRLVQSSNEDILPPPTIDNVYVPQGLAGNSAYVIKPDGGERLIRAVHHHGLWPNDAIMCRQILPNALGVTKNYYTTTQRLASTTTD